MSVTDDLEMLRSKIQEYINAGVQLAWLINPQQQQVEIYRQKPDVEVQIFPHNYRVKMYCQDLA
ncbi:MAG: Uma2 family endonuclease [Nostoc sp.]